MLTPPAPPPQIHWISQDNLSRKISFIIDLFESVWEENCSLVSCEKSVHCLLYNFQKRYILQQPISSWFLLKRKKIESSWHYWHFQTPPVHPSNHSFNNEWNLGPRRNKDGGWNACLFKLWTLQWFHRLFSTSTPRLKRLTIFWRIFRRLAYFHVRKCATSQCSARSVSPDGILKVGFPVSRFRRNIIETIIPLINVRTEISKRLRGFL